jgi:hypothetical protein
MITCDKTTYEELKLKYPTVTNKSGELYLIVDGIIVRPDLEQEEINGIKEKEILNVI